MTVNKINVDDLSLLKPSELDKLSSEKGERYAKIDKIRTNQIRNIYTSIKQIKTKYRNKKNFDLEIEKDLILLKPIMAYATGRQYILRDYQEFLFELIDKVLKSHNKELALENFFSIIESFVAYHKFYGGKDN